MEPVPEAELERQIVSLVEYTKGCNQKCWHDPALLAHGLGIVLKIGLLGNNREGAVIGETIVVSPASGTYERWLFTSYHELMHKLIRRDDRLLSILHEQYSAQSDFERIIERLSNVGAAEFLIPRSVILSEYMVHGYSVSAIKSLRDVTRASATAICVQLGLSAPHKCLATISRKVEVPLNQTTFLDTSGLRVTVDLAICSRTMKYKIAKGVPVPPGHLIHKAFASGEGDVLRAPAGIPFRKSTNWIVECEAMRLGSQVFALFHVDPPPTQNAGQLGLDLASGRLGSSADPECIDEGGDRHGSG